MVHSHTSGSRHPGQYCFENQANPELIVALDDESR